MAELVDARDSKSRDFGHESSILSLGTYTIGHSSKGVSYCIYSTEEENRTEDGKKRSFFLVEERLWKTRRFSKRPTAGGRVRFYYFACIPTLYTHLSFCYTCSTMNTIKPGKYQHYKGGLYEVVTVGRIEATLEEVVVYKALYTSPDFGTEAVWVRPVTSFLETVTVDGKTLPRFTFIS